MVRSQEPEFLIAQEKWVVLQIGYLGSFKGGIYIYIYTGVISRVWGLGFKEKWVVPQIRFLGSFKGDIGVM